MQRIFFLKAMVYFLLFLAGTGLATEADSIRIVVVPFKNNSIQADNNIEYQISIENKFKEYLTRSKRLTLVERKLLPDVLQEHIVSQSGLTDPAFAVQVGHALGASFSLVGEYLVKENHISLYCTLVDVSTTQIHGSYNAENISISSLSKEISKIAATLETDITGNKPRWAKPWYARHPIGTIILTGAAGGGGYFLYKELTKKDDPIPDYITDPPAHPAN